MGKRRVRGSLRLSVRVMPRSTISLITWLNETVRPSASRPSRPAKWPALAGAQFGWLDPMLTEKVTGWSAISIAARKSSRVLSCGLVLASQSANEIAPPILAG